MSVSQFSAGKTNVSMAGCNVPTTSGRQPCCFAANAGISKSIQRCSLRSRLDRMGPADVPQFYGAPLQRSSQQNRRQPSGRRAMLACIAASNGKPSGPVIVVDNYDSFTYNLCQYLGDLGCEHIVLKNDEKTVEEIREMQPRGILVSPGPGRPEDSGISLQIVQELGPELPVFGVCMGHQCIGQVFGGNVVRAPGGAMHGKTSLVYHNNTSLLKGLQNPFQAARYHSLVIDKDSCPEDLEVTAWTEDGVIMGVQHKQFPHIQGVQFHPESVITFEGKTIVQNFIDCL